MEENTIVFFGTNVPPLVLGPGEEETQERRIAHILQHGGWVMVKNVGKLKAALNQHETKYAKEPHE
jgi:hypothetical protein